MDNDLGFYVVKHEEEPAPEKVPQSVLELELKDVHLRDWIPVVGVFTAVKKMIQGKNFAKTDVPQRVNDTLAVLNGGYHTLFSLVPLYALISWYM